MMQYAQRLTPAQVVRLVGVDDWLRRIDAELEARRKGVIRYAPLGELWAEEFHPDELDEEIRKPPPSGPGGPYAMT